nr:cation:proton antiporter [Blastococcus sp. KM273129]
MPGGLGNRRRRRATCRHVALGRRRHRGRRGVVPIGGFLVAGVLIGPAQLGVVDSSGAVQATADIGVILLLFTIGIEFSLERLARVWTWIAVAGGLQLVLASGTGLGLTLALGGQWRDGLFTGFRPGSSDVPSSHSNV